MAAKAIVGNVSKREEKKSPQFPRTVPASEKDSEMTLQNSDLKKAGPKVAVVYIPTMTDAANPKYDRISFFLVCLWILCRMLRKIKPSNFSGGSNSFILLKA